MQPKSNSAKKAVSRLGTAAVEFAIIAPLMITFTFGLVELGRITLVKQTATHATREGARIAIRPDANADQVIERVEEELSLMGIEGAIIETEPSLIEEAEMGSTVKVRVRLAISSISWVSNYFDFGDSELIAESSMRRESTN
ncbi:TadE-like protein [Rubripirellula lacrimiformis]|uniref:TadE-like protein n=1 Tax=Rubripirellula lacrimiformis TaxID=1930273 RepID=A0A517NG62_9BACT|nr:TadE family protein [Rubripirellula lacrimiformis]QDT06125.1 TadE-like protein [Rubripirellula lacrimiformis]